ncbi:hypothetical protein D3C87_1595210 [compost metagenome]
MGLEAQFLQTRIKLQNLLLGLQERHGLAHDIGTFDDHVHPDINQGPRAINERIDVRFSEVTGRHCFCAGHRLDNFRELAEAAITTRVHFVGRKANHRRNSNLFKTHLHRQRGLVVGLIVNDDVWCVVCRNLAGG